MMMTLAQIARHARLLGSSREELAKKVGVPDEIIKGFELRGSDPRLGTVNKWRQALQAAGVHADRQASFS
jgi:predicted transcriptional regulator